MTLINDQKYRYHKLFCVVKFGFLVHTVASLNDDIVQYIMLHDFIET